MTDTPLNNLPLFACQLKCRRPPRVHPSARRGVGVDRKWLADRHRDSGHLCLYVT